MGLILLIIAVILTGIVFAINIIVQPIYYIFTFKWKQGSIKLNEWYYTMALSVDQFGNVATSTLLQLILTKKLNHPFGNPDDTVSYVIALNRRDGYLTGWGRFFARVLDKIDKNHLQKAIENKYKSDLEAVERIKQNKY